MHRTTDEEYAAMVSKGAELLDQKEPLWYIDINTLILNMQNSETCIAGQLYPGQGYVSALLNLGLDVWDGEDREHGFDLSVGYVDVFGHGDFEILNVLWTKEIMERRDN